MTIAETFSCAAHWTARECGRAHTFYLCNGAHPGLGRIWTRVWIFGTWQLIINTGTTIITFLMVFLIQNTQPGYSGHSAQVGRVDQGQPERQEPDVKARGLTEDDLKRLKDSFTAIGRQY